MIHVVKRCKEVASVDVLPSEGGQKIGFVLQIVEC